MTRTAGRRTVVFAVAMAVAAAACAHQRPPAFLPSGPSVASRLDAADALVRAGCLDCLLAAYREYSAIRVDGEMAGAAASGAIRVGALIDIRERELGLLQNDYLTAARNAAAGSAALSASFSDLLEIVGALRLSPGGVSPSTDEQVAAMLRFATSRAEWGSRLREGAPYELLGSYAWLAFACDTLNARSIDPKEARALLGDASDMPLLTFGYVASCERINSGALIALLERDSRFIEANYLLGLFALRQRPRPDVDAADQRFRRAYEWRQDWPTLTLSIANLALATEDFDRAFEFFDRTLALEPEDPDALVGTIRALTYLRRYSDALDATRTLLATGRNLAEARYWRAFNENQIGQYEEAWEDIETAGTLIVNAEVPKLAGIIAYRRHYIEQARERLEEARRRNLADCETGFYLQTVLAEQSEWDETAAVGSAAGLCFNEIETILREDIRTLQTSKGDPPRVARQITRREEQIATNHRMRATVWFNEAVAMFNLGRHAEARALATTLVDDDVFGDRARALLSRLTP